MPTVLPTTGLKIYLASDTVAKEFWNDNTNIIHAFMLAQSGGGIVIPATFDGSATATGYAITIKGTQEGSGLNMLNGSIGFNDELVLFRDEVGILNLCRYGADYSLMQINAPPYTQGSNEATLCLMCNGPTAADEHFVGFYNEEYVDERQCGIRIQKRGSMAQKNFVIDFYDGQTPAPLYKKQVLICKPNGTVSIPINLDLGATTLLRASTNPTPPDDGNGVVLYGKKVSGRTIPAIMEYTYRDKLLMTHVGYTRTITYFPGASTTIGTFLGLPVTSVGAISHPLANTGFGASLHRTRFASSAAAAAGSGVRGTVATLWRGNGGGRGGFFAVFRFSMGVNTTGHSMFVGLAASVAALAGNPSALTDMIGVGFDAADLSTGNMYLMMNDASGTATRINTNCPRAVGAVYTLTMYANPSSSFITVTLEEASAGTIYIDSVQYTTDLPTAATFLTPHCEGYTGALTSAVQPELIKMFIETDY